MLRLSSPINRIDGIGTLKTIVYSLLVTHHFLTGINKRYTLGSEYGCLRQFVKLCQFYGSNTRNTCFQPIHQAHIIMAGNIADHLCRLFRPRSLTIIHRVIIYLRMPDGSYNTKLYTLLSSRQSGKESTLMIVIERTAQSITHFVRESSNTRHLISIGFHCQRIFRHLWSRCRPSFTIYKYSRIYRRCRLTDFVHCLDVMDTHQVKTESVNVIFINPM